MDVGTGDGRFVLRTARSEPQTLVVGIDADATSMMDTARRASRKADRGGAPNALFVVSAAEALPAEMAPIADRVTIHFPWGSLLRGLLRCEPQIILPIVRLARPRALVSMLVSVTNADHATGLRPLDVRSVSELATEFDARGVELVNARPATDSDIRAANSTWAKRLAAGGRREAWLLEFRRRG